MKIPMSQDLTGTCNLCGKTFSRVAMTRHLKSCPAVSGHGEQALEQCFLLLVEARPYWLHLAAPVDAPLSRVDAFLRKIWLECCGHLSAFTVAGKRYTSSARKELGNSGMSAPLNRILQQGLIFHYEYDLGSTTELKLKVVGLRDQAIKRGAITLLARNDPPQFTCDECRSQPAVLICTECLYKDKGLLCASCADEHECDPEVRLPVVNSPRTGVCGYAG